MNESREHEADADAVRLVVEQRLGSRRRRSSAPPRCRQPADASSWPE
jgi:hypothetical protein